MRSIRAMRRVLVGSCVLGLGWLGVAAPVSASAPTASGHVFEVVMENLDYASAMATPSIAALARRYAYASDYYGVAHPSLPNYLALSGGSTFATTSDCVSCYVNAPNLFSQLAAAHVSFDAYLEGVPSSCYLAPWGGTDYASKHNPWRYYLNVRAQLCNHLRAYSELVRLLRGPAAAVPRYVWVTPNLCHDGHDCSAGLAGAWLTGFVAALTASPAWRDGGILYVTWDEANGDNAGVMGTHVRAFGGGGRVLTLLITPGVHHVVLRAPANHYSLLATIEDHFHLARLGFARGAAPLRIPGKS